jgi:CheY-like chemotaxis protein
MTWTRLVFDWSARLAWPLLVGLVLWRLSPYRHTIVKSLGERLEKGGYSVDVAGLKLSVQEATDSLSDHLDELRERLSALETVALGNRSGEVDAELTAAEANNAAKDVEFASAAIASDLVAGLRNRILWVDDEPQTIAYDARSMESRGINVGLVTSTDEALKALVAQTFDLVITNISRSEGNTFEPDAGRKLIERMREARISTPVYIYYRFNEDAAGRAQKLRDDGLAKLVTSSATTLHVHVDQFRLSPFHKLTVQLAASVLGVQPSSVAFGEFLVRTELGELVYVSAMPRREDISTDYLRSLASRLGGMDEKPTRLIMVVPERIGHIAAVEEGLSYDLVGLTDFVDILRAAESVAPA